MLTRLNTVADWALWLVDVADVLGGALLDRVFGYHSDAAETAIRDRLRIQGEGL